MNKYIKYWLMAVIPFITFMIVWNYINTINSLETAKKALLNERASDDKILVSEIKNQNIKIEWITKLIEVSKKELEQTKIINICTKTQLDRLMQWVEYNVKYCTWSNLENFKGLE